MRANRNGQVGFLKDWCRTNVALTRARNGLIVVGHPQTLQSDTRSWGPFLKWASAMGVVVGRNGNGNGMKEDMYDVEGTRSWRREKKNFWNIL